MMHPYLTNSHAQMEHLKLGLHRDFDRTGLSTPVQRTGLSTHLLWTSLSIPVQRTTLFPPVQRTCYQLQYKNQVYLLLHTGTIYLLQYAVLVRGLSTPAQNSLSTTVQRTSLSTPVHRTDLSTPAQRTSSSTRVHVQRTIHSSSITSSEKHRSSKLQGVQEWDIKIHISYYLNQSNLGSSSTILHPLSEVRSRNRCSTSYLRRNVTRTVNKFGSLTIWTIFFIVLWFK